MSDNSVEALKEENERLTAELEKARAEVRRTQEVVEDLWSHDVYVKARRKLTVGVLAILAILSGLGLFTVYDMYMGLLEFAEGQMTTTIEDKINSRVDEMISEAEVKVAKTVDEKITALIETKKAEISAQIVGLESQVSTAKTVADDLVSTTERVRKTMNQLNADMQTYEATAQKAGDAFSERVRQVALAVDGSKSVAQGDEEYKGSAATCDPDNLRSGDFDIVTIRHSSSRTGTVAGNGNAYYENTYRVDFDAAADDITKQCLLKGIDRVVYKLDPKWFRPAEIVQINRKDLFRYSVSAWGPTPMSAEVFVVGSLTPIRFTGSIFGRAEPGRDLTRAEGVRTGHQ